MLFVNLRKVEKVDKKYYIVDFVNCYFSKSEQKKVYKTQSVFISREDYYTFKKYGNIPVTERVYDKEKALQIDNR